MRIYELTDSIDLMSIFSEERFPVFQIQDVVKKLEKSLICLSEVSRDVANRGSESIHLTRNTNEFENMRKTNSLKTTGFRLKIPLKEIKFVKQTITSN